MKSQFPGSNNCFINNNFNLLAQYYQGQYPLTKETTLALMEADATLLPDSLGKPPMLTIMALAKRISKLCC